MIKRSNIWVVRVKGIGEFILFMQLFCKSEIFNNKKFFKSQRIESNKFLTGSEKSVKVVCYCHRHSYHDFAVLKIRKTSSSHSLSCVIREGRDVSWKQVGESGGSWPESLRRGLCSVILRVGSKVTDKSTRRLAGASVPLPILETWRGQLLLEMAE